jgi:hypothetical protein
MSTPPSPSLLVVVLAVAGVLTAFIGRERPARTPGRWRWLAEGCAAVAIGWLSYFWLKRVNQPPGDDAIFLEVADCLHFDHCFTGGAGASLLFRNGGVWPEVMMAVWRFGGRARILYEVVLMSGPSA